MSRIIIAVLCVLCSCSKKADPPVQPAEKATLVFWTANMSRLAACSFSGITIHVYSPGLNGSIKIGEVVLHSANTSEPGNCNMNFLKVDILPAGPVYTFKAVGCNGNPDTTGAISFLNAGECRKVEIK